MTAKEKPCLPFLSIYFYQILLKEVRKMRFKKVLAVSLLIVLLAFCMSETALACSIAGATGDSTTDGRPVLWKNRDSWGSSSEKQDCWKAFPFRHEKDYSSFGSGDTYTDRFDFIGVTDVDSYDTSIGEYIAWGGANEKGLGLVQSAAHTLANDFQTEHNYTPDQDLNGMTNGLLNHFILSRCETIDEVEQLLRDTNNGGGWNNSTARNTNSILMVFDRYGNMATYEVCGTDFTRDNTNSEYDQDPAGNYSWFHNDDKNLSNPPNGYYNGYDWRANFSRVGYSRSDGFPFFVDNYTTIVSNGEIINYGYGLNDGIHDWEPSTSAVKRWTRIGIRMDDDWDKDYQFMINKSVTSGGLGSDYTMETLARNIGELPAVSKETGYHLNKFVTITGIVITGSKIGDPYDGKLTTIWLALGEPTLTTFVPIFPYAGDPPTALDDMYVYSNQKRHLVYSYTNDDSTGYSSGRNADHSIDCIALCGQDGSTSKYYGEGGIQAPIFATEEWAYEQYENLMDDVLNTTYSLPALQTKLSQWQTSKANQIKSAYINNSVPTAIPDDPPID